MCKAISKTILVILNIVTMVAGILIITAGALILQGTTLFRTALTSVIQILKTTLKLDQTQIDNAFTASVNYVIANARPIAIPLIVLGVLILLISVFGIVGACCSVRCLLIVYAAFIGLILVAHIGVVIAIRVKETEIKAEIKKFALSQLVQKFKGSDQTDAASFFVNLIQIEGQCCGVNNYQDFTDYATPTNGKAVLIPSIGCYVRPATLTATSTQLMKAPVTCCKIKACTTPTTSSSTSVIAQCITGTGIGPATATNANVGCWSWITTTFIDPAVKYLLISLVALVFYVALIVLVAIILHKDKKRV